MKSRCMIFVLSFSIVIFLLLNLFSGDKYEPTPTNTPTPTPTNTPTPTSTPSPTPTPTPDCPLTLITFEPSCGVEAGGGYYLLRSCLNGGWASEYCGFYLPRPQYYYSDCLSDGIFAEFGAVAQSYLPIFLEPAAIHYPNGERTAVEFGPISFSQPLFYERGTTMFRPPFTVYRSECPEMRTIVFDPNNPSKIVSLFGSQNGWLHVNYQEMPPGGWKLVGESRVSPIYCNDWTSYHADWNDVKYIISKGSHVIDFPLSDPVSKYNEIANEKADQLYMSWRFAPVADEVTAIEPTITFKNVDAEWIHPDYPFERELPLDPPIEVGAQLIPTDVIWKTTDVNYSARLIIKDPLRNRTKTFLFSSNQINQGKVTGLWDGCFYEEDEWYGLENVDYQITLEANFEDRKMHLYWTAPENLLMKITFFEDYPDIRFVCDEPPKILGGENFSIFDGKFIGNPVKLATGEKQESATDLTIEGRGIDFSWERYYRSRKNRNTSMGNRWDFSCNRYLEQNGSDIIVNYGDQYTISFKQYDDNTWWVRGQFEKLTKEIDGTYTLEFPGGEKWKFRSFSDTTAPGRIYEISDRNLNTLCFFHEYGTIPGGTNGWRLDYVIDALNRQINVSYNANGYISSLTDFTGRCVTYEYYGESDPDGNPGDLKSVTSPPVTGTITGNNFPNGQTVSYTYHKGMVGVEERPDLKHNLLTITDARRNDPNDPTFEEGPYLTNIYGEDPAEPSSYDRVKRQVWGDGIIDIYYKRIVPSPSNGMANLKVITNDRVGDVYELYFNQYQNLVKFRTYSG